MRLYTNHSFINPRQRRRGMSFIETVSSVVILTLLVGVTVGIMSIMTSLTHKAKDYSELRVYEIEKLAEIRNDLELSLDYRASPISSTPYSEFDMESQIRSVIEIYSAGNAFGEDLYVVNMTLTKTDTGTSINSQSILRGGCVADDG